MKKIAYLLLFSGTLIFAFAATRDRLPALRSATSAPIVEVQKAGAEVQQQASPRRAEVLFLGNPSSATAHNGIKYAAPLSIDLFKRNINITYTADTNDLNAVNLAKYDALIIYADYPTIGAAKEKALRDFVEGGKGLIPLHTAAASFANSSWYVQAVGARVQGDTQATFTAANTSTASMVTQGISPFATTDAAFSLTNINPDKTILQERVENGARTAQTWTRNQGRGRVFYTAFGHTDSTWVRPDFVQMLGNGVLWSLGTQLGAQVAAYKAPALRYDDTIKVPNYPKVIPYTALRGTPIPPKFQFGLSPEQSMAAIQVPVDFKLELFAAEPDITNPIAIAWDERGRLWVVESVDYPNTFLETDGASNDRIKICEDTNGDGKADKFTVFADKLNIPTSMVFANGGVIVSMAPHFVFLKDTNGDDKADVRENIITGWGKTDTHAGPSNLQYGFDNKIWGVVGYSGYNGPIDGPYNGVAPGTEGQSVFRFNVDGKQLEFLGKSTNNTWGLGMTEDNSVFVSTANGDHSDYFSLPGKYITNKPLAARFVAAPQPAGGGGFGGGGGGRGAVQTVPGSNSPATVIPVQRIFTHNDMHPLTPFLRQVDQAGGYTAAAGHHFYTARNFPKEYWNRIAFVNEPTGKLVHNAIIERNGAGYTERDGWNLLASNDEWVGPVHTEVGPDGAVWVADWYNYIIQHNPQPSAAVSQGRQFPRGSGNAFVTPMRDLERGRIYRVVYKNAKPYTPIRLSRTDLPGLINALKSDNMFWRTTAQRLIVETKNMAALPELYKIINDKSVDEIGLNGPALHALWTVHGLGALSGSNAEAMQVAISALSHPAAGVRKAAVQVLPSTQQSLDAIQKVGLLNDKDLNTRMFVLAAITEMPASDAVGRALYTASIDPVNANDEWLSRALFAAVVKHEAGYLAAMPRNILANEPAVGQQYSLPQRIYKGLTEETLAYMYNPIVNPNTRVAPPAVLDAAKKALTIRATVRPPMQGRGGGGQPQAAAPAAGPIEGFIIGQGGKDNGFGIYVQGGKVNYVVNQAGKSYKISSTEPLAPQYNIVATLGLDGAMSLSVDDKVVGTSKAPSAFASALAGPIRSGSDNPAVSTDKFGDYADDFKLKNGTSTVTVITKIVK